MAAANASARGQRTAILASPLAELTGFALVVDCRGARCGGERSYAITALAACYGPAVTVGNVLRQMRCARGCGGRPLAALVGDWTVSQRADQTASGATARAGSEGVTSPIATQLNHYEQVPYVLPDG
jgi:hypothetical protein